MSGDAATTKVLRSNPFTAHLLLSAYMITPAGQLATSARDPSVKTMLLALLHVLACTAFSALGLLGIIDGPGAVQALLSGRSLQPSTVAMEVPVAGVYLLLVGLVAISGFMLPWGLATLVSRPCKAIPVPSTRTLLLASCYAVPTPMIFIPLVHVLSLWIRWSTVHYFMLVDTWFAEFGYYGAGIVTIAGALAGMACFKRMAGMPLYKALVPPTGTLTILIVLVVLLVRW